MGGRTCPSRCSTTRRAPTGWCAAAARQLTADRVGYMAHPDWVGSGPSCTSPPTLWPPRISTREGLKATAHWYREKGWL